MLACKVCAHMTCRPAFKVFSTCAGSMATAATIVTHDVHLLNVSQPLFPTLSFNP